MATPIDHLTHRPISNMPWLTKRFAVQPGALTLTCCWDTYQAVCVPGTHLVLQVTMETFLYTRIAKRFGCGTRDVLSGI